MKKKDAVKISREQDRALAITMGRQFFDGVMEDYQEPTRSGIPKGKLIGFSRKKKWASLLMFLYNPPDGLGLKEIAKIVGVSPGVLRLWRTEEAFKKAANEACTEVGEVAKLEIEAQSTKEEIEEIKKTRRKDGPNKLTLLQLGDQTIAKILKSEKENPSPLIKKLLAKAEKEKIKVVEIDDLKEFPKQFFKKGSTTTEKAIDFWARSFPFFNPLVAEPIINSLREKIDSHIFGYLSLAVQLKFFANVKDEKSLKRWRKRLDNTPGMKELTKALIKSYINTISDPRARKQLGAERIRAIAEQFKHFLFRELNLDGNVSAEKHEA